MKIKDLIKELSQIENKEKDVNIVGNNIDCSDNSFDCNYKHFEIIEDSDEAITIFATYKQN